MTLFELIAEEAAPQRRSILIAATLTGVANTVAMAMVNGIAQAESRDASLVDLGIFAVAIVLYVVVARYTTNRLTTILESALHRMKTRIVAKVEQAGMAQLEQIGTAQIYDRITDNMAVISESAGRIAFFLQSLGLVVLSSLYLASLSLPAFAVLAALSAVGLMLYAAKNEAIGEHFAKAAATRLTFFNQLNDLLKGFKEVKFSRSRGRELRADLVQTSASLSSDQKQANALMDNNFIFANCLPFIVLGSIVFVFPALLGVKAPLQQTLITVVLFAWGPLGGCLGGVPAVVRSNAALAAVAELERQLDAAAESAPEVERKDPWNGQFSSAIEVAALEYTYESSDGWGAFRIGPINLTIEKGEVLFIVGGNGSGKSTFLKNLTGLYRPRSGTLRVDDVVVTPESVTAYRDLFSAIFSDFHLFSKLYGLANIDAQSVQSLLEQMRLQDKTAFADNRFTKRTLSTGQRKRLAMIVTLLEDRPICVFDEWAADQDPEFRKYFYEELLPSLKRQGKTVIAVSHDDRFFHCADRVVTLEFGKIRSIEPGAALAFIPPGMAPGPDRTIDTVSPPPKSG